MKTKIIKQSLSSAVLYVQKLCIKGGTGCFESPVAPPSCPSFDAPTAEYIHDCVRMYIQSWILPRLSECLLELDKSAKKLPL